MCSLLEAVVLGQEQLADRLGSVDFPLTRSVLHRDMAKRGVDIMECFIINQLMNLMLSCEPLVGMFNHFLCSFTVLNGGKF